MPAQLRLVKTLSRLQEERRYSDEILLEAFGLAFTRGTVVEVSGGASTGKTSLALNLLAKLTNEGEICALVDAAGGFDPCSASKAGVGLNNLLWVKCGGDVEKAFLSADHLVQAKGFGSIWLDLSGLRRDVLRMVPKTYWYRYRTRIKDTPTIMLATSPDHISGSGSQQTLVLSREKAAWSGRGKFKLLRELHLKCTSQKGFYGPPGRAMIEMDYSEA